MSIIHHISQYTVRLRNYDIWEFVNYYISFHRHVVTMLPTMQHLIQNSSSECEKFLPPNPHIPLSTLIEQCQLQYFFHNIYFAQKETINYEYICVPTKKSIHLLYHYFLFILLGTQHFIIINKILLNEYGHIAMLLTFTFNLHTYMEL